MASKNLDPFWEFWSKWELEKGQMRALVVMAFLVLLAIVVFEGIKIGDLMNDVTYLSRHRVMYGFPNEAGVLVSGQSRPLQLVRTYARMVVNNLYDYDAASVQQDYAAALQMFDSRVRGDYVDQLKKLAMSVQQAGIQQFFTPTYVSVKPIQQGYEVVFEGDKTSYGAGLQLGESPIKIVVDLAKVSPTASRYAGLSVMGVHDYPIKESQ